MFNLSLNWGLEFFIQEISIDRRDKCRASLKAVGRGYLNICADLLTLATFPFGNFLAIFFLMQPLEKTYKLFTWQISSTAFSKPEIQVPISTSPWSILISKIHKRALFSFQFFFTTRNSTVSWLTIIHNHFLLKQFEKEP